MVNTREAESTKTSSDRALVLVNKLEEWLAGQGEGFKVGHHPSGLLIADFIKLGDPDDSYQRRLLTRTGSAAAKYTNAVDGFARPIVDGRRVAMMPRVILYSLIEDYDRNQLPNRGLSFGLGARATLSLVLQHTEAMAIPELIPEPVELPHLGV